LPKVRHPSKRLCNGAPIVTKPGYREGPIIDWTYAITVLYMNL
jgi:hypothetical protein